MNNNGQVFFYALMLGVVIMVLALAFANPIKLVISSVTNTDSLNCTNTTLIMSDKAACVATDSILPLFVGFVLFLGGAVLVAKVLIQ